MVVKVVIVGDFSKRERGKRVHRVAERVVEVRELGTHSGRRAGAGTRAASASAPSSGGGAESIRRETKNTTTH